MLKEENKLHHLPYMNAHDFRNEGLMRRPFGFRPIGFGFPFLGGFLGGLAAGALFRPPYYPPYPIYPPYPPFFYGGFW